MSSADRIAAECDALKALLLQKNAAYGDSALNPARVFSKASPVEQLLVRADDKLARIRSLGIVGASGDEKVTDTIRDLAGYLILLLVALNPPRKCPRDPGCILDEGHVRTFCVDTFGDEIGGPR